MPISLGLYLPEPLRNLLNIADIFRRPHEAGTYRRKQAVFLLNSLFRGGLKDSEYVAFRVSTVGVRSDVVDGLHGRDLFPAGAFDSNKISLQFPINLHGKNGCQKPFFAGKRLDARHDGSVDPRLLIRPGCHQKIAFFAPSLNLPAEDVRVELGGSFEVLSEDFKMNDSGHTGMIADVLV